MYVEALSRYDASKTRLEAKGSLAMALHVHHDFLCAQSMAK